MVDWGPRVWRNTVSLFLVFLIFPSAGIAQQGLRTNIERLIRTNQLDPAEQQLWGTLRAHPDDVWALDLLATIRLKQKRDPEAQALFQRAYSLNARDVPALRGLGEGARSSGSTDDAANFTGVMPSPAPNDHVSWAGNDLFGVQGVL